MTESAYEIRLAINNDLPRLTDIYNQSIRARGITADLDEQSVEQRRGWFEEHQNNLRYPLYVLVADGAVQGYGYLGPYRTRRSFDQTAEVSYYFDHQVRGRGYGSAMLQHLIEIGREQKMTTLIAAIFNTNTQSAGLLKKFGFAEWGRLPRISFDGENYQDQVYYGREI
ncbi:N-acetyltransferase family protein [Periweissella cryptocerci]|uniref:N-acetyltransferase family protein n=1 Tax=Periweissella cryptocerci TaxID=2506420 RepID=A0A4P6YVS0_9LACO|nr:GNAT family N-acetyltransferase [Periweissella cryptocerci]QBO36900.1 N-acetyltransferase family protein [Periweissella cryptocerci]